MGNDHVDVLPETTDSPGGQPNFDLSHHLLAGATDIVGPGRDAVLQGQKAEIDKNLPSVDNFAIAEKAAGLTGDPAALREALAKHVQHDLDNGSLKPDDLTKFPRVGGAFVATGAVTEAEMDKALAKQSQLAHDLAGAGGKPPRIGDVLADMYKDDPDKLAKIHMASKFYDELHKLVPPPLKA
jgi:hypothetical protein